MPLNNMDEPMFPDAKTIKKEDLARITFDHLLAIHNELDKLVAEVNKLKNEL